MISSIHYNELKKIITNEVFVKNKSEQIGNHTDPENWIFDFRRVLLNGVASEHICELFEQQYKDQYPFQICSLEVAGVPLVAALVKHLYQKGYTDINGFFIRKSRKKGGLSRMIEGEIIPSVPVILVDDIINGGGSFLRQLKALEEYGCHVTHLWSIIRYRDMSAYKPLIDNYSVEIKSPFTLDDFSSSLGSDIKNTIINETPQIKQSFSPEWVFKSAGANLEIVNSKSQPILDESCIYVGSESRNFWCINQFDGSVKWKFKTIQCYSKKSIFSNPVLYQDRVIFGSYDGNLYALNKETGQKIWTFWDADFIGSSPVIAENLGAVYIGLEFNAFRKKGGIAAVCITTGKLLWADYTHPGFTHSTPLYIVDNNSVVIGCNDGVVRSYDAKNGSKNWDFMTTLATDYNPDKDNGFGEGAIKESFLYDTKTDSIIFGCMDGFLYIIDAKKGTLKFKFKSLFGIWSTPCLYGRDIIFSSLDKHVRSININTHQLRWEIIPDYTRIYSGPTIINGHLYVGTNGSRLYEIDPDTGKVLDYFQATERITNTVIFNVQTQEFFLPTYANEIIKITKK